MKYALSTLAGFVDAVGFLSLGGFYVAFMSGNSTLLAANLAGAEVGRVGVAAGLVAAFVVGVAAGTVLGRVLGMRRAPGVLLAVAAMLLAVIGLGRFGSPLLAGLGMAVAMGAENTVLHVGGQTGVGLTYMTGTLVRVGQRLGEGRWVAAGPDVGLWLGMIAGAFAGALVFERMGLNGLWVAVAAAVGLAMVAARESVRDAGNPAA